MYLLNVVNTINKGSVMSAISKLQQQRSEDKIDEAPVIMNNEYYELFKIFESISTN